MPIFEWVSRTHMAYYTPNGESIHDRKVSRTIILVLRCSPCRNDSQQVPGRLGLKLTTLFELVHNAKPDSKTWFELFSIGYFNNDTDNTESRYKLQARTLDGIAFGRDNRSNSIIFYSPTTSIYYCPPYFRINEWRLPITNLPNPLRFYGGLTWGLLRKNTDPIHEPFPPGTWVSSQRGNALARSTIKNIPIPVSPILKCAASPSP